MRQTEQHVKPRLWGGTPALRPTPRSTFGFIVDAGIAFIASTPSATCADPAFQPSKLLLPSGQEKSVFLTEESIDIFERFAGWRRATEATGKDKFKLASLSHNAAAPPKRPQDPGNMWHRRS